VKIAVGSDHAGLSLKKEIIALLKEMSVKVQDFGCSDTWPVDYPDVARPVAEAVAQGEFERGILICGTGIGMSITANKVKGVRAALCHDTFSAHTAREHNDANILCMGQRVIGSGPAMDVVKIWVAAEFSGEERHARRVQKIEEIEVDTLPGQEKTE
jgi:ribose 5-phosphate isomerase B